MARFFVLCVRVGVVDAHPDHNESPFFSMSYSPWLWVIFTCVAAGAQTARNLMQRSLTARLGTVGASHTRFLFGLPFALISLTGVAIWANTSLGVPIPPLTPRFWSWTALGALAQIGATVLMLATMRERSFVVATTYVKTEPVQVALFALLFLGERVGLVVSLAIIVATVGVMLMSWPKPGVLTEGSRLKPALMGVASGALFALAAVGFRAAILALGSGSFVLHATTTLACSLTLQTAVLTSYLLIRERAVLAEIFRAWRPSLFAGFMGAMASQMWFLAFAIETPARVRTLALIEILFAQIVARKLFAQGTGMREGAGIALVVIGVILLLNG
jgi:drug/metabolite transporter (DMT)-like permease